MYFSARSSRRRFAEYRQQARQRRAAGDTLIGSAHGSLSRPYRPRQRSFVQLLGAFWPLLKGFRGQLIVALAALGVATLLGLSTLYGTKIIFDYVLGSHPLPPALSRWLWMPQDRGAILTWVAVAMVTLASVAVLVRVASRWQTTRITKRVQVGVRRRVFEHAVRLPLHRVYELKSGGVASILREDAGSVADLVFALFYNPWRAIVQLVGGLIVLATVDWRLLLGSLALLPTVWVTHRTWIARIRPLHRDIRANRQQIDARATEAFGGMRVVRSFSRQQSEAAAFTRENHLMVRKEMLAWWWMRGIDAAWDLLVPLASALLLFYGGHRVLADMQRLKEGLITPAQALTVGDLVLFLTYLAALLGPIAALAESAASLQNSFSALDRVLDLLAEPREMPPRPGARTVDRHQVRGRITLQDVCFAYPAATPTPGAPPDKAPAETSQVLKDINLDVAAGQTIALVGPSGAGKTTLCNLVARFYDPVRGRILLDGNDLRDITIESYRRLLGIVEQDTFLFDGTIAQNIAYGRRHATQQEIIQAAQAANADGFIRQLPQGYETVIGERGVKLSGGQRQRLTVARALLADPRILILDEATSNLDTESERLIQASLQALMVGRTSFVIAHRLSTIQNADHIVVMEGGRIIEQGRHDELMRASGRYQQMVELQTAPPRSPAVHQRKAAETPGARYQQPTEQPAPEA